MGPNQGSLVKGKKNAATAEEPVEVKGPTVQEAQPETTSAPKMVNGKPIKKAECGIGRAEFLEAAKSIMLTLTDSGGKFSRDTIAEPKEFATGSFGWNANEKLVLQIGDKLVKVQVGLNITVVGSKEVSQ